MSKKGLFSVWAFDFLIIVGLLVLSLRLTSNVKQLRQENYEQSIMIQANSKQIPYITRYIKLVKELTEVSKDKLTAYEVVEVSRIILTQCQMNQDIGLTPDIVMAMMERESHFNPNAISYAKAFGLMQVTRTIFDLHLPELGYGKFTKSLALSPIVNVEVGIKELVRLRKYWLEEGVDSWMITVNSYFWGIRNTWELFLKKKRAHLPSLEYGKSILDGAREWRKKGL